MPINLEVETNVKWCFKSKGFIVNILKKNKTVFGTVFKEAASPW